MPGRGREEQRSARDAFATRAGAGAHRIALALPCPEQRRRPAALWQCCRPSAGLQNAAQARGLLDELRLLAQRKSARRGKIDGDTLAHASRPSREQQHLLAEERRLIDRMRDEENGGLRLPPNLQKLLVEAVARDLVERAEGLVHQQQLRPIDERA